MLKCARCARANPLLTSSTEELQDQDRGANPTPDTRALSEQHSRRGGTGSRAGTPTGPGRLLPALPDTSESERFGEAESARGDTEAEDGAGDGPEAGEREGKRDGEGAMTGAKLGLPRRESTSGDFSSATVRKQVPAVVFNGCLLLPDTDLGQGTAATTLPGTSGGGAGARVEGKISVVVPQISVNGEVCLELRVLRVAAPEWMRACLERASFSAQRLDFSGGTSGADSDVIDTGDVAHLPRPSDLAIVK